MKVGDLVEEALGARETTELAFEKQVFEYPRWRIVLKATVAWAMGFLILYAITLPSTTGSKAAGGVLIAAALWSIWQGISVIQGLRRVRIVDGTLSAEFGRGKPQSWPLNDLVIRNMNRAMYWTGQVLVRVRKTGEVALRLSRDLPGWERVVAQIPSSDDAA